jgi:two-component system, OmpR family, response regulator RegX3
VLSSCYASTGVDAIPIYQPALNFYGCLRQAINCRIHAAFIVVHYNACMRILLVEDETAIREVEAAYLGRVGYQVAQAVTGSEAIDLFESAKFDLVVLDLNLPGASGLDVCKHIRTISMVPIIMVTASSEDADELHGLGLGADDYLKKPFNPQVLVARVNTLLRRHANGLIRHGNLEIDPEAMMVSLASQPIDLTATQFNILCTLARHPGQVLSRSQLLDQSYDEPAGRDIYDRTIDAHIRNIRRALGDDPARPRYIQTIIGRGYRFDGGDHA